MEYSINEIRVGKIMEKAQAEIYPFLHKKSKRELIAICMVDICDGLLHGKFTEEQIRATGRGAYNWFRYVCNMDFRESEDDDYFEKYAEYLGYKYKSVVETDINAMLDYHAEAYYQAAQKIVKMLDKKRLR